MALEYPYITVTGQSEEGDVEVQLALQDEYHLADESDIVEAVRAVLAARPAVASVAAVRYEIHASNLTPEA